MELSGLFLALIATLLVAYAVPVWASRRRNLAASRSSDRFSERITLLQRPNVGGADGGPSSCPILSFKDDSSNVEAKMSAELPAGIEASQRGSRSEKSQQSTKGGDARLPRDPAFTASSPASAQAAREYAALRARRAARISMERPAAQRRLLASVLTLLATAVVAVLAGMHVVAWAWLSAPAGLFVVCIAGSATVGARTKRQIRADGERLRELRERLRAGRPACAEKLRAEDPSKEADEADTGLVSLPGSALPAQHASSAEEREPSASSERASGDAPAAPALAAPIGPLPAPSYSRKAVVAGRSLHADTDIVAVRGPETSNPGRPQRATVINLDEVVAAGSGPIFKFDLDAVLDQRRAQ